MIRGSLGASLRVEGLAQEDEEGGSGLLLTQVGQEARQAEKAERRRGPPPQPHGAAGPPAGSTVGAPAWNGRRAGRGGRAGSGASGRNGLLPHRGNGGPPWRGCSGAPRLVPLLAEGRRPPAGGGFTPYTAFARWSCEGPQLLLDYEDLMFWPGVKLCHG